VRYTRKQGRWLYCCRPSFFESGENRNGQEGAREALRALSSSVEGRAAAGDNLSPAQSPGGRALALWPRPSRRNIRAGPQGLSPDCCPKPPGREPRRGEPSLSKKAFSPGLADTLPPANNHETCNNYMICKRKSCWQMGANKAPTTFSHFGQFSLLNR
jgi:hypothetical protein